MENQALSIIKPQATRIEHYPEVEERLKQHIAETEGQIERRDTILADLGEDPRRSRIPRFRSAVPWRQSATQGRPTKSSRTVCRFRLREL